MVDGLSATLSHNPLIALVTLFGAGLVTSLTPCIYPMIPITAGILSGTSAGQPSRARTARLTLAYVTGLALFYAILGLFAGLSGSLFGRSEERRVGKEWRARWSPSHQRKTIVVCVSDAAR